MSDFNVSIGRTGDKFWNSLLSNGFYVVIILSIYLLIYALGKSLRGKFYTFAIVALAIYIFNSYLVYYSFRFFSSIPNPSEFVSFGYQRMKTDSFLTIPFNRFVYLYIWALVGNYIVIPLAIIGINNTFSYFKQNLELQKENIRLELDFLKSQINPHFLFNSLNNIYSLYESNSEKVKLSREVLFLADYIELEKIRHTADTRITFDFEGDFENYTIPPFMLIPFIENAFKHGLDTIETSWICISIHIADSRLILEVSNGKPVNNSSDKQKGGIGLVNLKKRLDIYYSPREYELTVVEAEFEYSVCLRIDLK
jgi:two-component system LytT family sensor kinase